MTRISSASRDWVIKMIIVSSEAPIWSKLSFTSLISSVRMRTTSSRLSKNNKSPTNSLWDRTVYHLSQMNLWEWEAQAHSSKSHKSPKITTKQISSRFIITLLEEVVCIRRRPFIMMHWTNPTWRTRVLFRTENNTTTSNKCNGRGRCLANPKTSATT